MSRWASESPREQPWNAIGEVSAGASASRQRGSEGSRESVRRNEDSGSVDATWGSGGSERR